MSFESPSRIRALGVCTFAGLALAAPASAWITASDPFVTIHASAGSSTGSLIVPLSSPDVLSVSDPDSDLWGWTVGANTPILDAGNNVVATLVSFNVMIGRVTQLSGEVRYGVDFDFSIVAGSSNTTVEIFSPTLFFTAVPNAIALSSAGYNATDQDLNGVTVTPGLLSGFSYESLVNNLMFQQYMSTTLGPAGGTVIDAGNPTPIGVFQPVLGGLATSIQSHMMFTISANDAIAGSSQVSVAPSPGSASLLALGALVAGRRRRN
jgi:MYXO-CTERM domain-containing protein